MMKQIQFSCPMVPVGSEEPAFDVPDLIFIDNPESALSDCYDRHITHILCLCGSLSFSMVGKRFILNAGEVVIWTQRRLVSDLVASDDFRAIIFSVSDRFARKYVPNTGTNYDIIGTFSLLRNPVLSLTEEEAERCRNDLQQIKARLETDTHRFRQSVLGCLSVVFFLDLYDIHARMSEVDSISPRTADLLSRFIERLASGEYRTYRDVAYYASQLCVVPKYLSEICKKASGYSATYWIDRFTIYEIIDLLRDKELSLSEISDRLNFSSVSHFSRYVHRLLGVSPSDYRRSRL